MSEPDDKPKPQTESVARDRGAESVARDRGAESAASPPQPSDPSSVDSEWDALLGSPSSSGSDRPIFAPPGSKPPRMADAPKPEPRTSRAGASVSGEFVVAERPEPTIPTRFRLVEPPSDDDGDDDPTELTTSRLQIVPRTVTLDDESERAEDIDAPVVRTPELRVEGGDRITPIDPLAPLDPLDPSDPSPEPVRRGGAGKLVLIGGTIAAVVTIATLVHNSREDDRRDRSASSSVDEPSGTGTGTSGAGLGGPVPDAGETSTGSASETETGETGEETEPVVQPKPKHVDPRDPSVVPPGTPEENAKAFLKLPVSIHDGPPIGGIGRSGIHIDEVATARGRDNTDCDEPTQRFSVSGDEYVNVCFRVVHVREQEWLRVIWEKDGKVTRRGRVRIPDLHAYTTRAYLLLRPEYVGSWKVRIVPEGEDTIDLAVAEFEIDE